MENFLSHTHKVDCIFPQASCKFALINHANVNMVLTSTTQTTEKQVLFPVFIHQYSREEDKYVAPETRAKLTARDGICIMPNFHASVSSKQNNFSSLLHVMMSSLSPIDVAISKCCVLLAICVRQVSEIIKGFLPLLSYFSSQQFSST